MIRTLIALWILLVPLGATAQPSFGIEAGGGSWIDHLEAEDLPLPDRKTR